MAHVAYQITSPHALAHRNLHGTGSKMAESGVYIFFNLNNHKIASHRSNIIGCGVELVCSPICTRKIGEQV